jgi:hypothetical protein
MNKLIVIGVLILSANRISAEMGSMSRCLASFEFKDGQKAELYFHANSEAFYQKEFIDKYHFKNYVQDSLGFINEVFTKITKINCPKSKSNSDIDYYSIYQSNFRILNFDSIVGVVFIENVVIPWDSYVPIKNDSIILELTNEECVCINFDIDMETQDDGGDSIETYYLFTTQKSITYEQAEFEINQILKSYKSSIGKLPFQEKQIKFDEYFLEMKNRLESKEYIILMHY